MPIYNGLMFRYVDQCCGDTSPVHTTAPPVISERLDSIVIRSVGDVQQHLDWFWLAALDTVEREEPAATRTDLRADMYQSHITIPAPCLHVSSRSRKSAAKTETLLE